MQVPGTQEGRQTGTPRRNQIDQVGGNSELREEQISLCKNIDENDECNRLREILKLSVAYKARNNSSKMMNAWKL